MERKRSWQPEPEAPAYSFFANGDSEPEREPEPEPEPEPETEPETERRQQTRFEPAHSAVSSAVRLIDLSSHGCCLGLGRSQDYRPGQFIRLGLPGETKPMRAIVRWTETGRVGAEFTRQLGIDRVEAILSGTSTPMIALM